MIGMRLRALLRRSTLFFLGMFAGVVAAALATRALLPSRGDAESDEVELMFVADGRTFTSRAPAFRGGTAGAWMAGVDIDLRRARLDPAGARLELNALASGISMRVPPDVRAEVALRSRASGVSVDLAGVDDLPPEAPRLLITGVAVGCGVAITNRSDDEADA
jgi:hypothetical protein